MTRSSSSSQIRVRILSRRRSYLRRRPKRRQSFGRRIRSRFCAIFGAASSITMFGMVVLNLWPSFGGAWDSKRQTWISTWEQLKDYIAYCKDDATDTSFACERARSAHLPAPGDTVGIKLVFASIGSPEKADDSMISNSTPASPESAPSISASASTSSRDISVVSRTTFLTKTRDVIKPSQTQRTEAPSSVDSTIHSHSLTSRSVSFSELVGWISTGGGLGSPPARNSAATPSPVIAIHPEITRSLAASIVLESSSELSSTATTARNHSRSLPSSSGFGIAPWENQVFGYASLRSQILALFGCMCLFVGLVVHLNKRRASKHCKHTAEKDGHELQATSQKVKVLGSLRYH